MRLCLQTKGRSLEEMEQVFDSKKTQFDVEGTRRKAEEEAKEGNQHVIAANAK